ncbi:MAG TPA: pseudouridine synthase [Mobilitalea sp.]|nr:pseudouridine synthase [Mobilitalea sp.]
MSKQLRLDRYLSDMRIGTRSELKGWIRNKRVEINGTICVKPEAKVVVGRDEVHFDGQLVEYQEYTYLMLHKPVGVVSATADNLNKTVIDLVEDTLRKDLFPVGRLDKDTEGFLLLTNDGELAHRLLSPKKHVDKVYYARVDGQVTVSDQEAFQIGVSIEENYVTLPAKLDIITSGEVSEIELTIHEGKFHQVKRMFEAVGKKVVYLKRLSMGGLILDPELAPGEYRRLTTQEIEYLKSLR